AKGVLAGIGGSKGVICRQHGPGVAARKMHRAAIAGVDRAVGVESRNREAAGHACLDGGGEATDAQAAGLGDAAVQRLKGSDVDSAVDDACKASAALIVDGRVRVIAGIDGRAACEQSPRLRGAAIVLERAKLR